MFSSPLKQLEDALTPLVTKTLPPFLERLFNQAQALAPPASLPPPVQNAAVRSLPPPSSKVSAHTPAATKVAAGGNVGGVPKVAGGGGGAAAVSSCGIGVQLQIDTDGRVFVSFVDRNRGAWQAKIFKDNRLLKVDGTAVSDITRDALPANGRKITCDEALDRVTQQLKGEKGSHVQVKVEYYCRKAERYFAKTVSVERK